MKVFLLTLLLPVAVLAQQEPLRPGVHQLEAELHRNDHPDEASESLAAVPLLSRTGSALGLGGKVFGWHPYWAAAGAYLTYDYNALSHIAYFSYEVDTATGGYTTTHGWDTTPIITHARERGVKVILTVTNFGYDKNDKILSDTVKRERLITTVIALLKARSGDGVNFDLETIRNTQRGNMVSFIHRAATRIKAELPAAEISMATPAVDWSGTWDFAQLAGICDYLIVMGYDYYYSGSSTAGPVAPLEGENYNITRTIDTYVAAGVPRQKLLLGVPWFGLDWPVQSSARKAPTTNTASSRTYIVAEPMAQSYGKVFDQATMVPWFAYSSGSMWRQVWYDDSLSLALKYALVRSRGLAGIGIWALSYDGGRPEIWNGITSAFATTNGVSSDAAAPDRLRLLQNFPNPFNGISNIRFRILDRSWVTLKVYDLLGRQVAVLVNERKEPGNYTVTWDAAGAASDAYVCRLTTGTLVESRKMLLLR
jgi:spore germination protein YaaH